MSKPLRRSRRLRQWRDDEGNDVEEPASKKPSPDKKIQASQLQGLPQQGVRSLDGLPDELLLSVCQYCHERDLCRLAQVSKRLNRISSDKTLWKRLFTAVFEMPVAFDLDLRSSKSAMSLPPSPTVSSRISPTDSDCSVRSLSSPLAGPVVDWKSQFRTMHGSYHVSPPISDFSRAHRHQLPRQYFERLSDALASCPVTSVLDDAMERQMIVVHPGTYCEHVIVDRPVVIVGAGNVTLTSLTGRVVEFRPQARNSVLAHVTVKGGLPLDSSDVPPYYCIDISSSCCPIVQDCTVISSADGGACLYVHGSGACPVVEDCRVCDSESVGIYVDDGATGLYFNNDIFNNKLAGVWIRNLAAPIFRRNKVHHGRDVGFFVFDRGQGLLEANTVSENRIAGVEVKNEANPIVLKNNICNGKTGGVYIHDSGRGQFIENQIFGNQYAGVWITSDSNPTLKGNKIYNGKQGGVYIFSNGRGLLESNDIYGNTLAGVQIRSGSNPLVRRNKIHNGCHGGIYIHDGGMGTVEENEIYCNTLAGVWVTTGSQPVLRRNRIHSGKQVGVYFYDKGGGVLEDNEIYNHKYSGVQIRSQSNPHVRNNKIWGGSNGGILIYNEGQGVIEDNEVFENALAGIWIKKESTPLLRRNKIHHGYECGLCVFESGQGLIEDNDIFCNATIGVLINSGSKPTLRGNRIYSCGTFGLEVINEAGGLIENNTVFDNQYDGIALATGVHPQLRDNKVFNNHNLLEKTLAAGLCLFSVSGDRSFPMHDYYRCLTCLTSENNAVCYSCIRTCHEGHNTEFVRHDRFYCDCGAGLLKSSCQMTTPACDHQEVTNSSLSDETEEEL